MADELPLGGASLAALRSLLRSADLPPWLALRVARVHGDAALALARDEPYRLVRDVPGFAFAHADRLAARAGRPPDQPERVAAGLLALLDEAARYEGHVYLPRAELVGRAIALLGLARPEVHRAIADLAAAGDLQLEGSAPGAAARGRSDDAVYASALYWAEERLAQSVRGLTNTLPTRLEVFAAAPWDRAFAWLAQRHGLACGPDEQAAVRAILTQPLCLISAGPGSNWAAVVRAALALCHAKAGEAAVVTTTALAARQAGAALGRPVALLAAAPSVDERVDLLVVVHADRLDLWQAHGAVQRLRAAGHLALVGDLRALPPLGPGWPWADLATAAAVALLPARPMGPGGGVCGHTPLLAAAERIARGEPLDALVESDAFWFCPAADAEQVREMVVQLAVEGLPASRGIPPEAIAVLCLTRHGESGAATLGAALRARLGPPRSGVPWISIGGRKFRPGDRVILVESLPHHSLYRGTLARLASSQRRGGDLSLVLPDRRVVALDEADAAALDFAAALTVHEGQGGPFRAVIVPLLAGDYIALNRHALYGAIASASELCVIVGQERALAFALANDRRPVRYSRLAARLAEGPSGWRAAPAARHGPSRTKT